MPTSIKFDIFKLVYIILRDFSAHCYWFPTSERLVCRVSKYQGGFPPFRALSSSTCASGGGTAAAWLLHSSGGLEVGVVADPRGWVGAGSRQAGGAVRGASFADV